MADIVLEFDCAEPRVDKDFLSISGDGLLWDLPASSANVWMDPVTRTVLLRPLPTTAGWGTTFTGDYARLSKTSYTLTTPAVWQDHHVGANGNVYLYGLGTNERVTTTASYAANLGWYLSVFVGGVGTERDRVAVEFTMGTPGATGTIGLKAYTDGSVELWKGTTFLKRYQPERQGLALRADGKVNPAGEFLDFLIIPCRLRDLLVLSNRGVQFSHTFEDLSDDADVVNTITPAAAVSWLVPEGQAAVQLAPLRYAASGSIVTRTKTFRYPPPTGSVPEYRTVVDTLGSGAVAVVESLKAADGSTPFSPNGTNDVARLKVALSTSDTLRTPFLFASDAWYPRTRTETDGTDALDITEHLDFLRLDVPENSPATLEFAVRGFGDLSDAGLAQIVNVGDRPVRLAAYGLDIFRGTADHPTFTDHWADKARRLTWHAEDRARDFEDWTFADAIPFDGDLLTDAVGFVFELPGFDAATEAVLSTDTFALPVTTGVSEGEWQFLPQRGDTAKHWLDTFRDTFAATWWAWWGPTEDGYKWHFLKPEDLPALPGITCYRDTATADEAGVPGSTIRFRKIRTFTESRKQAEANQVIVIGRDPRTDRYLTYQWDDAAAQNPATPVGSRPSNWASGKVRRFQWLDPALTTQAAVDRAGAILVDRLTAVRRLAEWESDFLVNPTSSVALWRGDVVRIVGYATPPNTYSDWRIVELSGEFRNEVAGGEFRHFTYRAELVAEGGAPEE